MSEYILCQISGNMGCYLYAYKNGQTYVIDYFYDQGVIEYGILDEGYNNSTLFNDNNYCLLKIDINLLIEEDKQFYIDYTNKLIYDKLLNEGDLSANG